MVKNQRPGVYSQVSTIGYRGRGGRGAAALLLPGQPGRFVLESFREAQGALAGNELATRCAGLLFEGAARVVVITAAGVRLALPEIDGPPVRVILSGFTAPGDLAALGEYAEAASTEGRECIAFAGACEPEAAIAGAKAVKSGRVVLCCPALTPANEEDAGPEAIYGACGLAAAVLAAGSPVTGFNGLELPGLVVPSPLPEDEIQRLIKAGVCAFEQVGGAAQLIRAVTTQAGGPLSSLNTALIIDHVLAGVRTSLKDLLAGPGRRVSLESIRDLVAVELREKQATGIIESFEPPRVSPKPGDSSVALVEISFKVAHLLSQIYLTAFVRI